MFQQTCSLFGLALFLVSLNGSKGISSDGYMHNSLSYKVIEAGVKFACNCTLSTAEVKKNVTCIFSSDPMKSTSELDFQKMSSLASRLETSYHDNGSWDRPTVTTTTIIHNVSILDTNYYNCHQSNSWQNSEQYLFVHPPLSDLQNGSIFEEISTDDLLLPTLDVFVLEEGLDKQIIPFRSTHPQVNLHCSKRRSQDGRFIEFFPSYYSAQNKWTWDKCKGITVLSVSKNETNGKYWCEGILGNRITSRYFWIFVTTGSNHYENSTENVPLPLPRIDKAVEFLIFRSGSSFSLTCEIGKTWRVSWKIPKQLRVNSDSVNEDTGHNMSKSVLRVTGANYTDSGNYTCFREDAPELSSSQYVFIYVPESDGATPMLLPMNTQYAFNHSEIAILPCKPTHPDVKVSLYREGLAGRGWENVTIFDNEVKGDWLHDKYQGFRTVKQADQEIAGRYFCIATRFGVTDYRSFTVIVSEISLTTAHDGSVVVEGDEITLLCETYPGIGLILWKKENETKMIEMNYNVRPYPAGISNITVGNVTQSDIVMSSINLIWHSINKVAAGTYECRHQNETLRQVAVQVYHMNVHDAQKPRLYDESDNVKVTFMEGENIELSCSLKEGAPQPTLSWFREGVLINCSERFDCKRNGTLKFPSEKINEGRYTCVFENRIGSVRRNFQVIVVHHDHGSSSVIIASSFIVILLFTAFSVFFFYIFSRYKRTRETQNMSKVLESLLTGNPERFNRELPLEDQSELLAYDSRWEFPRDRLKLGKQLGAGCFGRVFEAEAMGIVEESVTQKVAVKAVRSYADVSALTSLVSELKILIHLGSHLNIVNFLGACTNITKGDFLVIVEYCRFGCLHDHILANRNYFVNQIDTYDQLRRNAADSEEAISNNGYILMGSEASHPETVIDSSAGYIVMQSDDVSVSYNNHTETNDEIFPISFSTTDLLCWSYQMARGMDYLSSKKVLHGDLAARNILLADHGVIKIADFGLSRKLYKDSNYKKKGAGMLPVKWMAIESLTDRIFSSQSDVWAFGITMWEFFSLGKTPYPDLEDIGALIENLENGVRMKIPESVPVCVSDIISSCWIADPASRPTFEQLEQSLGTLLETSVRNFYIDLNVPYICRNQDKQKIDSVMLKTSENSKIGCEKEVILEDSIRLPLKGYDNVVELKQLATASKTIYENEISLENNIRHLSGEYENFSELNNIAKQVRFQKPF